MRIIIEGACCTGKSTLIKNLCNNLSKDLKEIKQTLSIHFPTDKKPNENETKIYQHPKFSNEYGLLFRETYNQDYAYSDIVNNEEALDLIEQNYNVIVDRHLLSNIIYRSVDEKRISNLHFKELNKHINIILVADNPDILLNRFIIRNRQNNLDLYSGYDSIYQSNQLFKQAKGEKIIIDKLSEKELYEKVLSVIRSFR